MLSRLAQSYWQLLVTRMGVGVAEAGALPTSHTVISDRYGPHERASAMHVFMSGAGGPFSGSLDVPRFSLIARSYLSPARNPT